MAEKRNSFSSSIGFVLAAAGSAVGLGNIWRFPYLAAKDGGGLFLVTYLILALTFGFTLLVSEVAIGRKTKQSSLTAYGRLNEHFNWLGIVSAVVPFLILPYYSVIGGWVTKYMTVYLTGQGTAAAQEGYFSNYITGYTQPILFDIFFMLLTCFIIYRGVNKGIEALSRKLMPVLFVMVIGIAIFSLTIKGGDATGGRTGMQGFLYYVVPSVSGMSWKAILMVVMDAMGQLFYSISVAMGIMVTYASYFKDDENLMKSVNQIEIFDTLVAFLAGIMIIPAVYVYAGVEGMKQGPGLMFVALLQVFAAMGTVGKVIAPVFFVMVFLAALTSCMSILEAVVASLMDRNGWSRKKATIVEGSIALVISLIVCLGYNVFYFDVGLPNGARAQILDIMDYLSNNILMPIVAMGTCVLIGWVVKPKTVIDEVTKNGEKFRRRGLYIVMVKYIAPALLFLLFLGALGVLNKLAT